MLLFCFHLLFSSPSAEEDEPSDVLASSHTASQISTRMSSPLTRKKKKEMEMLEEGAQELLSHFSHRNVDALLKVTRNTLEAIRKRIHASSTTSFLGSKCLPSSLFAETAGTAFSSK